MYNPAIHIHRDLIPNEWVPVDEDSAQVREWPRFAGHPVNPDDLSDYIVDHGHAEQIAVAYLAGSRCLPARTIALYTLQQDEFFNEEGQLVDVEHYVVVDSDDPTMPYHCSDEAEARAGGLPVRDGWQHRLGPDH